MLRQKMHYTGVSYLNTTATTTTQMWMDHMAFLGLGHNANIHLRRERDLLFV